MNPFRRLAALFLVAAACGESTSPNVGPPAAIVFVRGAGQSAPAGSALPVTPAVEVRDADGTPVPDVPVIFSVVEGAGTVSSTAVTTDQSGQAEAPVWELGKSAVPQTLQATSGEFTARLTAEVASGYHLDLRSYGPAMSAEHLAFFTAAIARIRGAIPGDLPDVTQTADTVINLETGCRTPGLPVAFSERIDDVIIFASIGPIDGVANVLAQSFPCFVRGAAGTPDQRTAIGVMTFDSDDIANMIARGNFGDVIQHEMLHVLGLGTLWIRYNLLAGVGTASTRYTGVLGISGCLTIGGAAQCQGSVPVENTGGPGTADAHWRESVFANELMTGFVNTRASVPVGVINPMSAMTIQSLADLGYSVNIKAADPFTVPQSGAARILGQRNVGAQSHWEIVGQPMLELTPSGTVKRTILQ